MGDHPGLVHINGTLSQRFSDGRVSLHLLDASEPQDAQLEELEIRIARMLGIPQVAGIINIDQVGPLDRLLLSEFIPNLLTTAFILAALALGIAAPTLLFRRRKPVV